MAVAAGAAVAAETATTMAAVSAAVGIASTAYSLYAANQNANAQMEAAEAHNQQVLESTIANYDQLSELELEAQQQSLEESMDMQKDYLSERGRVNVMAAYSGTAGMSVGSQLQDLERDKYANFNTIQLNQQAQFDNIADQAESLRYGAQGRMNVSPISRPSWASAALDMGTSVIGGLQGYEQAKKGVELGESALTSGG